MSCGMQYHKDDQCIWPQDKENTIGKAVSGDSTDFRFDAEKWEKSWILPGSLDGSSDFMGEFVTQAGFPFFILFCGSERIFFRLRTDNQAKTHALRPA